MAARPDREPTRYELQQYITTAMDVTNSSSKARSWARHQLIDQAVRTGRAMDWDGVATLMHGFCCNLKYSELEKYQRLCPTKTEKNWARHRMLSIAETSNERDVWESLSLIMHQYLDVSPDVLRRFAKFYPQDGTDTSAQACSYARQKADSIEDQKFEAVFGRRFGTPRWLQKAYIVHRTSCPELL